MKPFYAGDLIPSISSYEEVIDEYEKGFKKGEFFNENIGKDSNYSDW